MTESRLPKTGRNWTEVKVAMEEARGSDLPWYDRKVFKPAYFTGDDVVEVADRAYEMYMSDNLLYSRTSFPSLGRYEDEVVEMLVQRHAKGRVLVIGQYISQLELLARRLKAPRITGKTPNSERQELYEAFRQGRENLLVVSKVGNFAIDLPDANVAIQVSGTFGSRQEEAQRLGRILRPKSDGSAAIFYSIVTLGSRDQEFAEKRQLFLTEQGYTYQITEPGHLEATLEPGATA